MKLNTSTLRGAVVGVGILLFLAVALSGCTFTAGYVSPQTGITYGLSHEFKLPEKRGLVK